MGDGDDAVVSRTIRANSDAHSKTFPLGSWLSLTPWFSELETDSSLEASLVDVSNPLRRGACAGVGLTMISRSYTARLTDPQNPVAPYL